MVVVVLRGDSVKITPLRGQKSDKYRDSWKSDNYTESNKEKYKQSTKLLQKFKQRGSERHLIDFKPFKFSYTEYK